MNETTNTNAGTEEQKSDFGKKLAEQMADISNPDTQNLIRKMFLDFLKQQRDGKTESESTDADRDNLNREIAEAVRNVLERNRVKKADVSISLGTIEKQTETNERREEPAPESQPAAVEPAPESQAAITEPEQKTDLNNVLDWIYRNMNSVIPCGRLKCSECPFGIQIGTNSICMKNAILDNAQKIRAERQ